MDALLNKDYDNVVDPSLLRFLVDVRGVARTPGPCESVSGLTRGSMIHDARRP